MSRLDAIRREKKESETRGSGNFNYVNVAKLERMGITQFRSETGDNFIAIIPPGDPAMFYAKKIFIHRDIGVDNKVYLCPQKMFGKKCPVCDDILRLVKEGADADRIKGLRPGMRFLFFVVDMKSDSTMKKGAQWFDAPACIEEEAVGLSENKRTGEIIDISDPVEGKNIIFKRTGTKKQTKYTSFSLEDRDQLEEEWLDVPDYDDVLQRVDAEVIENDYFGVPGDEDEGGEANGEAPPREARKPRRSATRGEEEEKPKRRSRRQGAKDEDKVDEKPKRVSRRQSAKDEDEVESEKSGRRDDGYEGEGEDDIPFEDSEGDGGSSVDSDERQRRLDAIKAKFKKGGK